MYGILIKNLLMLMTAFIVVGCLSKETNLSRPVKDIRPQTTKTIDFRYFKNSHQKKCDSSQRELLSNSLIFSLYDGEIESRVLLFNGEFEAKPFFSDVERRIVSKTFFNRKEVTYREMLFDKDEELIGFKAPRFSVEDTGQNLSICPDIEVPRDSVESMAIGINYRIYKSYNALNLARPNFELEPIEVYVQNIEENIFDTYIKDESSSAKRRLKSRVITYSTDNAYYSGSSIHFLPQSDDAREGRIFTKYPLWEIPFVASHEYGHHVFQTLLKNNGLRDKKFISGCFHSGHLGFIRLPQSSRNDALRAIHEGFSDLFAHYTLGLEGQLNGVSCFSESRNVMSPFFGNGDFKELDSRALKEFVDNKIFAVSSCEEPNFTQYHTVGAVYARMIYAILENEGLSETDSLRVIMDWAQDLAMSVKLSTDAEETFARARRSFISAFLKFVNRDSLTVFEQNLIEKSLSFDS